MRFRKLPVEIDAFPYNGSNVSDAITFTESQADYYQHLKPPRLVIPTLEGSMEVNPGDWIIKGVKGEFYPCKPDIFAATYEAVE